MSRIPLPTVESMTPEQRVVYDNIISGPRGRLVGPLRAVLHNPELADRWQRLGEILRFGTIFPPKLNELAILVTARRWNSQIEWYIHAQAAEKAGLHPEVIQALKDGQVPPFTDDAETIVYEYARQIQQHGTVDEAVYARAVALWGAVGVVELTAVIGYYTMVSMTLNAHEIPMPDEAPDPLIAPVVAGSPALSTMPKATLKEPVA
ncbi:carboxymuconolactone decarboxylase [Pollutimonas nitritireducens]|uniref:Carboxymuconolactone decarboxylase n=1 Tax=Pollutimonas nitritireducens TaxID=2045209 RepID=A0A2N4UAU1_9BURK|nr:carboxymuconolactone decarboxylase family protein [Pollutimonas nitritireducens]PLC52135.1 carboxymuconolactone decarboxylase [Pollutimonas nitritireducens]